MALLVPPLNGAPLCLLGLALRRRRLGRALAWIGALELLLLSLPVVSGALLVSLEQGLPLRAPATNPPGAIVVLGAERSHGADGQDVVGPLTLERLRAGVALHRTTGLPLLVTGGGDPGEVPLAELMARTLAQDFATPARWVEPRAADTRENARDSTALLAASGIGSAWVVTQAWHERRALAAFGRTGLRVTAAPVLLDALPWDRLDDYVPHPGSWLDAYFGLHEWIGIAADPFRSFPAGPVTGVPGTGDAVAGAPAAGAR